MLVTKPRLQAIAVGSSVFALSLAGCSTASSPEPGTTHAVDVDEPHADAGLRELADVSDATPHARVAEIRSGLTLGEDQSVSYKAYVIEPITDGGLRETTARVYVMDRLDDQQVSVDHRADLEVGEEAVWLLQRMAPEFGEGYVLTSSAGILPVVDGEISGYGYAPVMREADGRAVGDVLAELGQG